MDGRSISTYLSNLQSLYLIRREVSMIERAPEKSRKGRYVIQDNFINFWFRFVDPNITLLEINQGQALYQQLIAPQLNQYMGKIFENICQQFILHYGPEIELPLVKRIGQIWGSDFDIDVVAHNIDDSYTFAECKWSSAPINQTIIQQLYSRVNNLPISIPNRHLIVFSKKASQSKKDYRCVSINDLLTDI